MTVLAQNSISPPSRSRLGGGFSRALATYARARSAHAEYNELMMLSDAALASRGLTRNGIARYIGARHFDI